MKPKTLGPFDVEPFWPTREEQFKTFDRVANAALAEVGLDGRFFLWMESDGFVHCDPSWAEDGDSELVDRAVNIGWNAMPGASETKGAT